MEEHDGAKEAVWGEIQRLMAKQLTDGPLSEEELERLDRLTAAMNALNAPPEEHGRSGAMLNAFRQLALLRMEQEDSKRELQRISRLLGRQERKRRRTGVRVGAVLGLSALWLGLSLLLLLIFQWLDTATLRIVCAGSAAGLSAAVSLLERERRKRLDSEEEDLDAWLDGMEEESDL